MIQWKQTIIKLSPCDKAQMWLEQCSDDPATAWQECPRGDWMLWLAARGAPRRVTVYAACQCARLALPYVLAGEERPRRAIETTEAWCRGEATLHEVIAASNAATAASIAGAGASSAAATAASNAAAAASAPMRAAGYAAYAAANAAFYTDVSVASAAFAEAQDNMMARTADVVRRHITFEQLRLD